MDKYVQSITNDNGLVKGAYYKVLDETEEHYEVLIKKHTYWRLKSNFEDLTVKPFNIDKWKLNTEDMNSFSLTIYKEEKEYLKFIVAENMCDVSYYINDKRTNKVKDFEIFNLSDLKNLINKTLKECSFYNKDICSISLTITDYLNKQGRITDCTYKDKELIAKEILLVATSQNYKHLTVKELSQTYNFENFFITLIDKYLSYFIKD